MDEQNGLLDRFYAKADLRLRRSVITTIDINLRNAPDPITPEIVERLQKLWLKCLEAVNSLGSDRSETEEIKDFGWCFGSKKLPDLWSIDQVCEVLRITGSIEPDHLVVGRVWRNLH